MINFRWGQAAGQASGFNLAAAQAISRGLRKDEGWGGGGGGWRGGGAAVRHSVGPLKKRPQTRLFFRSSTSPPSLPPSPPSPPNLAELSG